MMTFTQLHHAVDAPGLGMFTQLNRDRASVGCGGGSLLRGVEPSDKVEGYLWDAGIYNVPLTRPKGYTDKENHVRVTNAPYVDYLLARMLLREHGFELRYEK